MRAVPVVSLAVDPDHVLESQRIGFNARTAEALVAAVRKSLLAPDLRSEYGARAREYALRTHSLHNARRLLQLIDSGHMDPESI